MEINKNYIRDNVNLNELGLNFIEYEYNTNVGYIDILCEDDNGNLIPIEVKLGEAGDSAIGQILGYMKCINAEKGIIIAQDFSDRVKFIAEDLNIDLVKYELNVKLNNNINDDNIFNEYKKRFISEVKKAYSLDLIDWIWIGNVQKDKGTSIDPNDFIKNPNKYFKYLKYNYYINLHYKIQNNIEKILYIDKKELEFNKIQWDD